MKRHRTIAVVTLVLLSAVLATRSVAEEAPCEKGERCADSRLAGRIMELLNPAELRIAGEAHTPYHPTIAVAANELIWTKVKTAPAADRELRRIAAEQLIDAYLRVGLSTAALDLFHSLDAAQQADVTTGPLVFGMVGDYPNTFIIEASPQLTAAGLAVALADRGDAEAADRLLAAANAPVQHGPPHTFAGDLAGPSEAAGACARQLLQAESGIDAFTWIYGDTSAGSRHHSCSGVVPARDYNRRVARLMAASTLPESWRSGMAPISEKDERIDSEQDDFDKALQELPGTTARIAQLNSEFARIDREDARWIRAADTHDDPGPHARSNGAEHASPMDRALAHTLAERLAAPLLNPYRITAAPKSRRTTTPSKPAPSEPSCAQSALRCLETPEVRWELVVSQDLDPTGEVPAAGYWLRRTERPGGLSRSYYLGLKEHRPFELADSTEAFIDHGRFRLIVRKAEIEPDTIMFPPVGLQFHGDGTLLQLEATLDDVAKDSDGDGLTDLAEQQLLLDSRNPDSDGDGIPDADDPLPNVAFAAAATPRHAAMASALEYLGHDDDRALSLFVPGSDAFVRRTNSSERTLFVVADPEDFAGLSSDRRIIVLPSSLDLATVRKRPGFAVFYPMTLSLKMLDEAHAELDWDAGWAGGNLVLELHDGAWRVGNLGGWVT